jgi:hypothetical protein
MITDDEQILICAARYSVGRMTYVVSDCCRWIRERWERLSPEARAILFSDLDLEVKRYFAVRNAGFHCSSLGMEPDRAQWIQLHAWMQDRMS